MEECCAPAEYCLYADASTFIELIGLKRTKCRAPILVRWVESRSAAPVTLLSLAGSSLPAPLGQGVGPSEEAVMVAGSLTPWLLLYNGNLEVNMLQHT